MYGFLYVLRTTFTHTQSIRQIAFNEHDTRIKNINFFLNLKKNLNSNKRSKM